MKEAPFLPSPRKIRRKSEQAHQRARPRRHQVTGAGERPPAKDGLPAVGRIGCATHQSRRLQTGDCHSHGLMTDAFGVRKHRDRPGAISPQALASLSAAEVLAILTLGQLTRRLSRLHHFTPALLVAVRWTKAIHCFLALGIGFGSLA